MTGIQTYIGKHPYMSIFCPPVGLYLQQNWDDDQLEFNNHFMKSTFADRSSAQQRRKIYNCDCRQWVGKITFENREETLTINWMDLSPAPNNILELIKCSCQKIKCETIRYTCDFNKLPCTDLCKCFDCENKSIKHDCIIYDQ